jgi:hypothetical protein
VCLSTRPRWPGRGGGHLPAKKTFLRWMFAAFVEQFKILKFPEHVCLTACVVLPGLPPFWFGPTGARTHDLTTRGKHCRVSLMHVIYKCALFNNCSSRIICPSGATRLPADCCFRELTLQAQQSVLV